MKLLSKRRPGERPRHGFLAACSRCGEIVVHADSTLLPFHMHRWSKKCDAGAAKRAALVKAAEPRLEGKS